MKSEIQIRKEAFEFYIEYCKIKEPMKYYQLTNKTILNGK